MNTTEGRQRLIQEYGLEVVVKCCREWKTHFGNGRFGYCGICNEKPKLIVGKKWED